jgi:acyl carrier protein
MDRKEIVLEVIAKISGVARQEITPGAELVADLGIDSPKALAMLVELEDRLEVAIDDELVTRLNSVADVLGAIERQGRSGR